MNVFYYPRNTNVIVHAYNRLSMENVVHVEEERKHLAKDIHMLGHLGVCRMEKLCNVVVVQN